jgi:hypothetical protein
MGGLGFYFVLIIVVTKDTIDIIWEIIEFFADVTVVLGIIMWFISTLMDLVVLFSTGIYFFLEGMPFTGQRKKVQIVSTVLEVLPIVGFLPINTIAFIWIRREENKRRLEEANQKQEELLNEFEQQKANVIATYESLEEFREIAPRMSQLPNQAANSTYNAMQRAGYKLKPSEPYSKSPQQFTTDRYLNKKEPTINTATSSPTTKPTQQP